MSQFAVSTLCPYAMSPYLSIRHVPSPVLLRQVPSSVLICHVSSYVYVLIRHVPSYVSIRYVPLRLRYAMSLRDVPTVPMRDVLTLWLYAMRHVFRICPCVLCLHVMSLRSLRAMFLYAMPLRHVPVRCVRHAPKPRPKTIFTLWLHIMSLYYVPIHYAPRRHVPLLWLCHSLTLCSSLKPLVYSVLALCLCMAGSGLWL